MGSQTQKMKMPLSREGTVAHNLTFQTKELGRAYRIFCYLMTRDAENFKFRGVTFLLAFRTVWARLTSSMKIYYLVSARQSLFLQKSDETDLLSYKVLTQGHRYVSAISASKLFEIPIPVFSIENDDASIADAFTDENPRPTKIRRQ